MFRTKKEVDKYVKDNLSKIKDENERKLRDFSVARMYFAVGEYSLARKYLTQFLDYKPASPPGHRLAGQIAEATGDKEAAVEHYKRSFELDSVQKDLLIKIIELVSHLPPNEQRDQFWLEKAEQLNPKPRAYFQLQQRVIPVSSPAKQAELETTLTSEVSSRPADSGLRIQLIQLHLNNDKVNVAFDHALKVETLRPFPRDLSWYLCVLQTCQVYEEKNARDLTANFYILYLNSLERVVALKLGAVAHDVKSHRFSLQDVIADLRNLDQKLLASQRVSGDESWKAFYSHIKGQLYLHMACVLLYQTSDGAYGDKKKYAAAALLKAFDVKPFSTTQLWYAQANETKQKEFRGWRESALYRISQAGHCLLSYRRDEGRDFIDALRTVFNEQGRNNLYQAIFRQEDSSSFFLQDSGFLNCTPAFPSFSEVSTADEDCTDYTETLHDVTWLGLRYYQHYGSPEFACYFAPKLPFLQTLPLSTAPWNSITPDSLCKLDVHAFVNSAIFCSAENNLRSSYKIPLIPAVVTKPLVSRNQQQWWDACVKLTNNMARENVSELRRVLQRGLEVVRLMGPSSSQQLSPCLLLQLARSFAIQVHQSQPSLGLFPHSTLSQQALLAPEHLKALENHASRYYKAVVESKSRVYHKRSSEVLFEYPDKELGVQDLDETRFFLACYAWRSNKPEEALKAFEELRSPYASYHTATLYKELAQSEATPTKPGHVVVLLCRARDALYLTLDRLRSPECDRDHPLNEVLASAIDDVEQQLAEMGGASTGNVSIRRDDAEESLSYTALRTRRSEASFAAAPPIMSTPRAAKSFHQMNGRESPDEVYTTPVEARPSPERLDAQLRQVVRQQDQINKTILEELRDLKIMVTEVKGLLEGQKSEMEKQTKLLEAKSGPKTKKFDENKSLDDYAYEDTDYGEEEEEDDDYEPEPAVPVARGRGAVSSRTKGAKTRPEKEEYPWSAYPNWPYPGYVPPALPGFPMPGVVPRPPFVPSASPMGMYPPTAAGLYANPHDYYGLTLSQMGAPPVRTMAPPPQPAPVMPAPIPTPAVVAPPVPAQQTATAPLLTAALAQPTKPIQPPAPANVVMTVSDKLPPISTPAQPLPSVTVPPQHRLGVVPTPAAPAPSVQIPSTSLAAPHPFQIAFSPQPTPTTAGVTISTSVAPPLSPPKLAKPLVLSTSSAIPLTTQGLLSSVPEPKYSAVSPLRTQEGALAVSPGMKGTARSPRLHRTSTGSENGYVDDEGYEACPDFKAIIPLPDLVEVKTGEEGEMQLFEDRAKLYRFVDKEWKERGVGQLKILHDESTGKSRLVMRREQVLKICANHFITPTMKLQPRQGMDTAYLWAAPDFADGEAKLEQFCVRFKTAEQAIKFKAAFEKAQSLAQGTEKGKTEEKKPADTKPSKAEAKPEAWGAAFKPAAGSWTCEICYVTNKPDSNVCLACETPKPGSEPVAKPAAPAPAFKFGVPAAASVPTTTAGGFKFGVPAAATASPAASTTTAPSTGAGGFQFGGTLSAPPVTTATAATTQASGFKFGPTTTTTAATSAPKFQFGSAATVTTAVVTSAPAPAFTFTLPKTTQPSATPTQAQPVSSAAAPFSFTLPTTAAPVKPPTFSFSNTALGSSVTPGVTTAPALSTPAKSIIAASTPATTAETGKFSFGGLSFIGTPKTTEKVVEQTPKKDETVKTSTTAVSPFAGFSFGGAAAAGEKKEDNLFSSLAKGSPQTGFKASDSFKGFQGAGAPVFGSTTPVSTGKTDPEKEPETEAKEDEEEGEFVPTAEFKPVIPLPDMVEVKTGEEEEEKVYGDRATLYRYVSETKEWKERGVGEFKILRHKATGKVRFLMRREQVLKVCLNHAVTAELNVKPLQTSTRAWTWITKDFAEGEGTLESFALKFKTEEQAKKFKQALDQVQEALKSQSAKPVAAASQEPKAGPLPKSLSELFKPAEGSWECPGCYTRNSPDKTRCPACETLKPGATEEKAAAPAAPQMSFKPGGGFSFGLPASTTAATATSGGFNFSLSKPVTPAPTATTTKTPAFSGFSFSLSPKKPENAVGQGRSPNVSVSSDNGLYEDDGTGDNIHFQPVIPLPEKVEVKTGEEDEEVLFSHRAKLLRFADGEWKERGLGDIKVLKHKTTNKVRLLMRREQILKICLNHLLTPELKFLPKDDRSWLWAAQDFSDGEPTQEKFVVRFKNGDIAQDFKNAIDKGQAIMSGKFEPQASTTKAEDTSDVEVVHVKQVSPALRQKALDLQLPANFYAYLDAPPCPGCRGCEREDDSSKAAESTSVNKPEFTFGSFMGNISTPVKPVVNPTIEFGKNVSSTPSFADLANKQPLGFGSTKTFSWPIAPVPVFGTPPKASTSSATAAKETNAEDEEEEEGAEEVTTHDPHFEPIVPLPDLVEVKTGEEEEEKVFCQRGKLFRYDRETKQWKERGIGEMKILKHPDKNTYRLLLRREQVHKLACNHALTTELTLSPLATSETAYCWHAMDFSEGELRPEQFAIKFKNMEIAQEFKNKFEECQRALKTTSKTEVGGASGLSKGPEVKNTFSTVREDANSTTEEGEYESDEDDEHDEDDEDYEDVEQTVMFDKRATMSVLEKGSSWVWKGTGDLKIFYDDEMLGCRIDMKDDRGEDLCDCVIAIETQLQVSDKECVWSAQNWAKEPLEQQTFRVQFSSKEAALEFKSIFDEGKAYAVKSEIHDEPNDEGHRED